MKYLICGEWGKPRTNDVPSECLLLTLPHPCLGPIASDPSKWWEPHTLPMSLKQMAKSSSGPSVDIDSACRKSSPSLLRLLLYIDRSYWGWLNLSPCSAVCITLPPIHLHIANTLSFWCVEVPPSESPYH